jgi:hypothetical protein
VQPFINLQRIKSVMLYGNPVLGPTGEDSMKIYIEDLANAAIDSRIGNPIGPIDVSFMLTFAQYAALLCGNPLQR